MSSKQLLRLAIVLAAVLLLWGAVALAGRSEGRYERITFLPKVDTSSIDTISLVQPRDTAIIVRAGVNRWTVNGHPADMTTVNQVLKGLADTAASSELIAQNASSHARLGLRVDSARRVRVTQKGRTVVDFLAGKQTPDYGGVYVRRANETPSYALRGELPNALTRSGEDFRDRKILGVAADSVGTIEVTRGSRSYTVHRNKSAWTFASGAPADSAEVAGVLSDYRDVTAAGFSTSAQEDSLHFDKPRRKVRLLNLHGAPLVSLRFDSIASGIWVRHDSGGPAYRLDTWTANRLAPADSTLRKKKS